MGLSNEADDSTVGWVKEFLPIPSKPTYRCEWIIIGLPMGYHDKLKLGSPGKAKYYCEILLQTEGRPSHNDSSHIHDKYD